MRHTLLLSLVFSFFTLTAQAQNAWINELHYDDTGGGSDFIEVIVENDETVDLSLLDVELYRDDGTRYRSIGDLDTDFVEERSVGNFTIYTWEVELQNGPSDGLALCYNDAPIQVLSYEGTFSGTEDCANGENSTDIGVFEDGTNANTTSLQLDGTGTTYSDFSWTGPTTNTKGDLNTGQTLGSSPPLTVDDDGGADYTSIQAAIDAAAAGDVIEVNAGTYPESVAINKDDITLQGASGAAPSDITIGGVADACRDLDVTATGVAVRGFTVVGAEEGDACDAGAAVVSVRAATNTTVENLIVTGPGASEKTGINLFDSDDVAIEGVTVQDAGKNGINVRSRNVTLKDITAPNNAVNRTGLGAIAIYASDNSGADPDVSATFEGTIDLGSNPNGLIVSASDGTADVNTSGATFSFNDTELWPLAAFGGSSAVTVDGGTFEAFAQGQGFDIRATFTSLAPAGFFLYDSDSDKAVNLVAQANDASSGLVAEDAIVKDLSTGDLYVGQIDPSQSMSIQTAVSSVASGGIVNVLPGTYSESVTVNQSLTLSGPNAGTPGNDANRTGEATIEGFVELSESNAVFDGFEVSPPEAVDNQAEAILINNSADGVVVKNNIVRGVTSTDDLSEDIEAIVAFGGNSDAVMDVTITNNFVTDVSRGGTSGGAVGISIQGNVDGATVKDNVVDGIGREAAYYALGIAIRGTDNSPAGDPKNVEVRGNDVRNVLPTENAFDGVGFEFEPDVAEPVTVESNTFTNTTLQVEDKTVSLNLDDILAKNTFDRAVVIRNASGDVKDESGVQKVYSPIAPAVANASPGETVDVYAGTYAGDLTIDKALTLRGASAGGGTSSSLTMASKSTSPSCAAGAVIDASGSPQGLTVSADDVTLEDLCVTSADNHNIYTNASISNLTLTGVEALNAGEHGMEIDENADITTLTINGSNFSGNINNIGSGTGKGLNIRGTVDGLTIDGSAFDHNNYGFYTTLGGNVEQERADGGSTNVSDVTITNTTFNDNPNKGIYAEKLDNATFENIEVINSGTDVNASFFPQAIDINLKLRNYGALTFRNATVRGSIGEGLNVKARNGFYGGAYQPPDDASLSSLTVENSVFAGNRWGVVVGYGVEDAEITGNLVNNNGNAVGAYQDKSNLDFNRGGVLFYATPEAATFTVNGNCITKNGLTERDGFTGYGLSTTDTPVDATNNWWGSAAGPGTGGANSAEGAATVDPFAIDPVSGVEGCGGAIPGECPASNFTEELISNTPPGKVQITIDDTDGIEKVEFYQVSNFTIASEDGEFADPDNDGIWTPSGSSPLPTSTSFMLTQADTDNPDASYFAQITNGCGTLTDIDPPHGFEVTPSAFALDGNYPNPFRTQTTLQFDLPEPVDVTLSVYDVMGRRVATLVDQSMPAGSHDIAWQGRGQDGQALASGVYFVRLTAGDRTATRRLTIVR